MSKVPQISQRKADHIDLCTDGDVGFRAKSTLFEAIELVHNALPELAVADVDLGVEFAGAKLKAPLVMAAMTGGVDRADIINRELSQVAEELGIGFAYGSQRPLLAQGITEGYRVRDVAPTALVLGNIGLVQAREASTDALAEMLDISGANALCVHLNPAMEVVQPEGDDDFSGGIETLARLVEELDVPVVLKETGCGISRDVAERAKRVGIQWVDTSGSGGTSWVAVEAQRAEDTRQQLGDTFWDWGIPTAASVAQMSGLGMGICATGGVSNGLMIAKAISLGATVGGIARPFLQAHAHGGIEAVRAYGKRVIAEIRIAALLTGSASVADLQKAPLVTSPAFDRWVVRDTPLADRLGR